ncbi:uncharacterized protein LOC114530173 [Dendronephthya gigantea]|uniref:uncharacterized protein LOC114530173 n=1 Tax=Dendronephthya gigantea TaxID=151771 RepID=UPI00106CA869|nr:uncharacterized protein LOC114530173 [Dendronephthya gigantea]
MEVERLSITDAQKQVLVDFYERGMVSTKKGLAELHVECASACGLSETQVKNWISNYKASKRSSGEPRQNASKSVLIRKRSGYNVFAKEQLAEGDSKSKKQKFSELGAKWKDLTDGQKEEYRGKARSLNDSDVAEGFTDRQRSKRIVNNLMKEVAELDNIDGVECLVICVEGGNIYHASTKLGQKFLEEYPDTCTKFGNVIQNVSLNNKIDVSDKMIRTIFNKKYSTLVGKASPLPYSAAESLGLKFNGLPSELIDELGCYPKQPNHYGAQQKRRLWERRNSFSFSLQSHMEIINTASNNASSSSTSSNPKTEYIRGNN